MDNNKALWKKIFEARTEKGVTQKQLGDFLGYTSMAISHFENGVREMKISDLLKLAIYFNKEVMFFLENNTMYFKASINN